MSDGEVCVCGHYRQAHAGGSGVCNFYHKHPLTEVITTCDCGEFKERPPRYFAENIGNLWGQQEGNQP